VNPVRSRILVNHPTSGERFRHKANHTSHPAAPNAAISHACENECDPHWDKIICDLLERIEQLGLFPGGAGHIAQNEAARKAVDEIHEAYGVMRQQRDQSHKFSWAMHVDLESGSSSGSEQHCQSSSQFGKGDMEKQTADIHESQFQALSSAAGTAQIQAKRQIAGHVQFEEEHASDSVGTQTLGIAEEAREVDESKGQCSRSAKRLQSVSVATADDRGCSQPHQEAHQQTRRRRTVSTYTYESKDQNRQKQSSGIQQAKPTNSVGSNSATNCRASSAPRALSTNVAGSEMNVGTSSVLRRSAPMQAISRTHVSQQRASSCGPVQNCRHNSNARRLRTLHGNRARKLASMRTASANGNGMLQNLDKQSEPQDTQAQQPELVIDRCAGAHDGTKLGSDMICSQTSVIQTGLSTNSINLQSRSPTPVSTGLSCEAPSLDSAALQLERLVEDIHRTLERDALIKGAVEPGAALPPSQGTPSLSTVDHLLEELQQGLAEIDTALGKSVSGANVAGQDLPPK